MNIQELTTKHNRKQTLVFVGHVILQLILWPLTFFVIYFFTYTILNVIIGLSAFITPAAEEWYIPSFAILLITLLIMLSQVIETIIFKRKHPDVTGYVIDKLGNSFLSSFSPTESMLTRDQGFKGDVIQFVASVGLILSILNAAPRFFLKTIKAWREIIKVDSMTINQAQKIFDELGPKRDWQPASMYEHAPKALATLHVLGLIWIKANEYEIVMTRVAPHIAVQVWGER